MTVTPYAPTPFTTPVANPAMGGAGVPYPYISVSEYAFAPTAMDTMSLVPSGESQDQIQSLADTIQRASAWIDRFTMGMDAAAKGASLCATTSVETDLVDVINGTLRLVCNYKPIIMVNGVNIGASMASMSPVSSSVQSLIRFGIRTIYVPLLPFPGRNGTLLNPTPAPISIANHFVAVWSYVNGYPHTYLTEPITAGQQTCVVAPTDGGSGLLGIIPNVTQMTIRDGSLTERFTVQSVSGTTITPTVPFTNAHALPTWPDFLPVTAMPADIRDACIFATTFLIKTRGDNSIVLDELTEPKQVQKVAGDEWSDLTWAMHSLEPFRVRYKPGRR